MSSFLTFEGCDITLSRLESGIRVGLKVRDGKFFRLASFSLTDSEKVLFANAVLEFTE